MDNHPSCGVCDEVPVGVIVFDDHELLVCHDHANGHLYELEHFSDAFSFDHDHIREMKEARGSA